MIHCRGQVAFGYSFNSAKALLQGKENEAQNVMHTLCKVMSVRIGIPQFIWSWLGVPYQGPQARLVNGFFEDQVQKVLDNSTMETIEKKDRNVAHLLLCEKEHLTEKELKDALAGIFAAGHE